MKKHLFLVPVFCLIFAACSNDNSRTNLNDKNATMQSSETEESASSDDQLTDRVQRALQDNPSLARAAKNVDVSSDNGTVTLKGTVASKDDKKRIEDQVKDIDGVKDVDNEIEVSK